VLTAYLFSDESLYVKPESNTIHAFPSTEVSLECTGAEPVSFIHKFLPSDYLLLNISFPDASVNSKTLTILKLRDKVSQVTCLDGTNKTHNWIVYASKSPKGNF